ncbi:MAG: HEAT repeat domain-containing protein [Pirellulales bacterium]
MNHRRQILAAIVVLCGALERAAQADIFLLSGGGEVRGTLVNKDQDPRTSYIVRTTSGGQVTLAAEQVRKVTSQSPEQLKYDQIRGNYADTVADQWKLAQWCRENRLLNERRAHLERIVELDPNHVEARHGLGYSQVQGRWVTHDAKMKDNGYVRYKGAWLLPQEIEIKVREEKEKRARLEWASKLRTWHRWLQTDKAPQAVQSIKAIDDPFAADALARQLSDPKQPASREVRLLYVEALGRLQAASGMDALVTTSLYDGDEEVRLSSLEQIVDHNYKPAVVKYTRALRDKENGIINRAAHCLGKMKDPAAVAPLIDALVTEHTFKIQKGQPGQTSATFGQGPGGTGGGGFTFGGSSEETIKQTFQNRDVLGALVELTGTSFNYDIRAWKQWYAAERRPASLDARRDDPAP